MTIPKNAGLSRLAEAASPIEYYPVRRQGQKRRLTPNWDAIRWLEEDTEGATEISDVAPLGAENTPWHSINNVRALGYYSAKRTGHYPRRMFDVFDLGVSSSNMISYADPCAGCQDFSRSWTCTEHPEVAWNTKRRIWERHIEDRTRCSCTPCTERRARAAARVSSGLVRSTGHIIAEERRLRETWASRLEALQDATLTVNLEGTFDPSVLTAARTLEIESETEQGAGPLAIEVEPSDGSTPAP
jgi:hypothetical protein